MGCGPVGALLAVALGRAGHRVAVFERDAEVFTLPRAVHLDAEAMRTLQSVGLAEAVLPWTIPTRGMEFVSSRGERYFGTVPRGAPPVETRFGWHRGYMFYQPHLERELRAAASRLEEVDLRLGVSVEELRPGEDGVEVRAVDAGGRATPHRARYAVGCDGAGSRVRRWIGSRLESLGYDRQWLVVDVFLRREVSLPEISQQVCDPGRPTTYIYSARGHRRWEFQLLPGEDAGTMQQPESVQGLLSRWLAPGDAEIVRAAVYEFHGVVAQPWRRGRVLLAGDAAHQMPPFQGQGLCSGIRDVANLAWKLGAVLDGRAPEGLLDSYEAERSPHARAVVASSIRVGQLIERLSETEARGETFDDPDAEANATRRAGWMPKLSGGLMPDAPEGVAGDLLVQPRVRRGGGRELRLDEALGPRFAVLAPEDPEKLLSAPSRQLLAEIDAVCLGPADLRDLDGWLDEALREHGALVVRPDRYVFGAAADGPGLDRVVDDLRRALGLGPG